MSGVDYCRINSIDHGLKYFTFEQVGDLFVTGRNVSAFLNPCE